MENINIAAKIIVCNYNELDNTEKVLVNKAKEMTKNAYSIYSSFQVGACILLTNNEMIGGCNQENAAYPCGICAERAALFYANSQYPDEAVDTIAIAVFCSGDFTSQPISPCGACRQVILEAENRYKHPIRLILYGKEKIYKVDSITDLLPLAFNG